MQLIGYMDSPFVRRVAISMEMLGIPYRHRELSIFRDYEEFRQINPLVKVPTLLLDDGRVLVDSGLIIDYLERQVAGRSLMPGNPDDYAAALRLIGIALVANEKVAGLIYETGQRPKTKQHPPWIKRLGDQLKGALDLLENAADAADPWLTGAGPGQADITVAVCWRFVQHVDAARREAGEYPALEAFSERAEQLDAFRACPLAG